MLTVKFVDEWSNERVWEVLHVHWQSGHAAEDGPQRLSFMLPDKSTMCLEAQDKSDRTKLVPRAAYVMNDTGATVASYSL